MMNIYKRVCIYINIYILAIALFIMHVIEALVGIFCLGLKTR